MKISIKLAVFFGSVCCALSENIKLKEVFSWKQVDFDFPDENARQDAISSGDFVPENNLPLGVEAWKNKLFVTCPRWKGGTAATLTYIDLERKFIHELRRIKNKSEVTRKTDLLN